MPRGRPRKPRLSRMDAAVDAMVQYGFPPVKVRKHVRDLLKVYGGDGGWPFIEGDAYTVLIEAILHCNTDGNDEDQVAEHGNMLTDEEPNDDAPAEDIAGPSGIVAEHRDTAEEVDKGWKDILPCQTSGQDIEGPAANAVDVHSDKDMGTKENEHNSPIGASQSAKTNSIACPSPPANRIPTRRRFPCYGWIESDEEDDDDDFIILESAVPRDVYKSLSYVNNSSRKRTSRWDQRSDDHS